ncbi:MAG: acetyl-CoA carboxylase biotin carboxyl carrier protein subunit [Nocardioides sp.]|nr:acetyl-CoA carboxylase biotin carboxyl carrier protein subunit [Nocardioides sp.]
MSEETPDQAEAAKPLLRVVNPDATPEEVAAIVAVFSAMSGGEAPPAPPRSQWNHPERMVRRTLPHGPGGWKASGLPR